jgi:hypothetical protein
MELNFYFDLTTPSALVKGDRPEMPHRARLFTRAANLRLFDARLFFWQARKRCWKELNDKICHF